VSRDLGIRRSLNAAVIAAGVIEPAQAPLT